MAMRLLVSMSAILETNSDSLLVHEAIRTHLPTSRYRYFESNQMRRTPADSDY